MLIFFPFAQVGDAGEHLLSRWRMMRGCLWLLNTADPSDSTKHLFHDLRILEATWRSILDEGD